MKNHVIRPDRGLYGLFEHMYRRTSEYDCEKILKQLEGQCPPSEPARYAEACALMARVKELKEKRLQPRTYTHTTPRRPQNTTQGVVAYCYEGFIYDKKTFERMINRWQQPEEKDRTRVENLVLA